MTVESAAAVPGRDRDVEDAVRDRLLRDPEVRERIERGIERLKLEPTGPGMTREELVDLLRESG